MPGQLPSPTLHRLSNGLTIVAEQMPIEAVNFSLWVHAGSAIEDDAINGMAHFLEHMVFKGSDRLQTGEFEQLIEQRGGITNAATSQDYTYYYITVAPQYFADLAPWQIETVLHAQIPDEAFERERLVILEEIRRSEDNPRRRAFSQAMELAFEQSPYRRPVLGPAAVIEQVTPQQMRQFHQTWYQPASMTAVAVGNLPVDELIEIVAAGFSTLPSTPVPHSGAWQPESAFATIVRHDQVDAGLQQAQLTMMWRVPGLNQLNQSYALDVLAKVLGQGRTSRLVQDLRETKGWVSSISASNLTHPSQGLFYISARLPVEYLGPVEAAIAQHIADLQANPIRLAELQQAQRQVANQFIFGCETPANRANLYGYYQAIAGDLKLGLDYPAQIQALTPEDLQAAAQMYLSPSAYGILSIKPGGSES